MKVVLQGCTPPPIGGIAKWTTRMMRSKLSNDWKLLLVDDKMIKRDMFDPNARGNNRNLFVEAQRWSHVWKKMWDYFQDEEVVLLHACSSASLYSLMAETVCIKLAKLRSKKIVIHFRCTFPNNICSTSQKKLLIWVCNHSDYIIALNTQTQRFLKQYTKTPIEVIPNFVEMNEVRKKIIIKDTIETVAYSGGVIKSKGCMDILEVAKMNPDIKFVLAGEASNEIVEAAKRIRNVILKGVVDHDELLDILKDADVFMFLSYFKSEGFSNSLAEAMGQGLPCIVTDWAANADMIENEVGGYVVPCQDPAAASRALVKLSKPEVRRRMSDYNFEKTISMYSDCVILDRYVDIYEKCKA